MNRREFIAGLGGAAAWPLAARGQERAVPVIGWLSSRTREFDEPFLVPFLRGLSERGYTEGRNIAIEYRWTETHDRMPALAAELVQRRVDVIFTVGTADTAQAAKAATAKIPIVFLLGVDPVQFGLVASLNHPGGNLTGYTSLTAEVVAKRLDLMHQLVPTATLIAVLTNPSSPGNEPQVKELQVAAPVLGLRLLILNASNESDFAGAFETIAQQRADGLVEIGDSFFDSQRSQLIALAARYGLPASYWDRRAVVAGGLMSYGYNSGGVPQLAADYVARILNGEQPANMPVLQATKFDMAINMKTAKALGLTVPSNLLALADEVIE